MYLDRTFAQQIGSAKVKSKSEITYRQRYQFNGSIFSLRWLDRHS